MLTTRADGFNPLVSPVNNILGKLVKSEPNIDIINNDSIRSDYHLNSSGVHLNRNQGRQNSRGRRGHGRGTFWPISIFIYRKSIEVFYSLMSILI